MRSKSTFSKLIEGAPVEDPTACFEHIKPSLTIKPLLPTDFDRPRPTNSLRFVCISDTFGAHTSLTGKMPHGDVLVHTGNFTESSLPQEISSFNAWLSTMPHKHKIVVAGSRDAIFDAEAYPYTWRRAGHPTCYHISETKSLLTACTYLEHTSTTVEGMKIFGSPYNCNAFSFAFHALRGAPMKKLWEKIPSDTDVLLTHTAPLGHGDLCVDGRREGCANLLDWVESYRPLLHIFGGVREGAGLTSNDRTMFINACSLGLTYAPSAVRKPLVIDLMLR